MSSLSLGDLDLRLRDEIVAWGWSVCGAEAIETEVRSVREHLRW
jgi:hypothetical protein